MAVTLGLDPRLDPGLDLVLTLRMPFGPRQGEGWLKVSLYIISDSYTTNAPILRSAAS